MKRKIITRKELGHPTHLIVVLVIIGVIIVLVAAGLLFGSSRPEPFREVVELTEEDIDRMIEKGKDKELQKNVVILNLIFADYIGEDYSFRIRPNNEFNPGEKVLVYHEVIAVAKKVDDSYKIGFSEDVELIDSDGDVTVLSTEGNRIDFEEEVQGFVFHVPIRYGVDTSKLTKKGIYIVKITVKDKFSADESWAGLEFVLK